VRQAWLAREPGLHLEKTALITGVSSGFGPLIAERGEPLHALVNNAGFAVTGDVTDMELREQFDTNFSGVSR